jgi:hypothetical protein
MPTIQIETEQLLNAALQMPRPELEQFVRRLFALKTQQESPGLSEREAELLMKINRGLSPETANRRKKLIAKREAETITKKELQELIQITTEVERLNVERVKNLIELASLRNVTLDELMDQLGLRPSYA